MGRKKKPGFQNPKMLSSRVELEDYYKFEHLVKQKGKSIQDVMNAFVVGYISGAIRLAESGFVVVKEEGEN